MNKKKLNILITGSGGAAVPSMIKIIKKYRNCNIVSTDMNEHSSGFLLSDKFYIVPSGDNIKFKKIIKNILIENNIDLIISVVDEELAIFSDLSKELNLICLQPNKSFIKKCLDKKAFGILQKKIGLNNLDTKLLSEINLFNKKELSYPIILKPRFGRGSRNIYKLNSFIELNKVLKKINTNYNQWITQKYISGQEYTVSVVNYGNNDNYKIVPKLIILKEGVTKIAKSIYNKEIENTCIKILEKLNPQGPFNVQCIIDTEINEVFIFEINPRFSTSTTLTVASGLDEINFLIDIALGKKINLNNIKWNENIKMIRNYTDYFSNKYEFN